MLNTATNVVLVRYGLFRSSMVTEGGAARYVRAVQVRPADDGEAEAIAAIYSHHVEHGYATFDTAPVSAVDRRAWMQTFAPTGPHQLLVAVDGDRLDGYACSSPYRSHSAFDETVEFSVYVAPNAIGRGVGSALYERLIAALERESVHRALVGIALPNDASVRLHERFGFERVGVFEEYAEKHGERISSVWMQRRF
ncbi:MAG: N-acetyltransferase family protein [Actinomycetota bacterium]